VEDALAAGWGEFYVATAGAGAALAGLVMVAISVNIKEILALRSLPSRAGAAVGSLILVVVTGGVGLIPQQSAAALGTEILIGTLLAGVLHAVSLSQNRHDDGSPRINRVMRPMMAVLQLGPLLVGAISLIVGADAGLYWIAAGIILTLIGSMLDAWVLMVEILR
jgi:modulator of FtsH protease